jgi:hypothetical protein
MSTASICRRSRLGDGRIRVVIDDRGRNYRGSFVFIAETRRRGESAEKRKAKPEGTESAEILWTSCATLFFWMQATNARASLGWTGREACPTKD